MHYYRYENEEVSCCYKYLMFSYNIIFWLAGAAFIAIGFWAWSEKGVLLDLTQVTRLHGFDPVWLVLAVGAITFILGFAGCVGALRENICLLKFFSGVIGFIFFLELTAAVLAFVFQDNVREWINDFFLSNVKAYREDIDLQNLIDSLQKMNHCCGAKEPDDWNLNLYFNCTVNNPSRERCGVPFSCCLSDPADTVLNTQCGYDVRKGPKVRPYPAHTSHTCVHNICYLLDAFIQLFLFIISYCMSFKGILQGFGNEALYLLPQSQMNSWIKCLSLRSV
uniref:Tetraspanin-33 n=1 Tax=Oncorhynchus mykiss TaxID=8022 RepID=A0A8C7WK09_ONCMY